MITEPLHIPGLAGPVVATMNSFTGKHSITVGGRPASGTRRGMYTLPTADGRMVEARLRGSLLDPYPSIEIAGVKHRTGPVVPLALRVVGLLPAVLLVGGLIGGLIGGGGIVVNLAILRSSLHGAVKAVLMLGVLVVAVVTAFAVIGAIRG